jgi:hypothetical protein
MELSKILERCLENSTSVHLDLEANRNSGGVDDPAKRARVGGNREDTQQRERQGLAICRHGTLTSQWVSDFFVGS